MIIPISEEEQEIIDTFTNIPENIIIHKTCEPNPISKFLQSDSFNTFFEKVKASFNTNDDI